ASPGLGVQPQRLVSFDVTSPSTLRSDVLISGLQPGETLKGIDFRPATGQIFGLGSTSRLYLIDPDSAVATPVSATAFAPAISSVEFFGFDFNPVPDRIRVISNVTDQNFRLNQNTGAVVDADAVTAGTQLDTSVAYAAGDPNVGDPPNIVGAAYANNVDGATSTTNFAIDARPDEPARLVTVGTRDFPNAPPGGTASSPNAGQLFTVGDRDTTNPEASYLGVRTNNLVGFDISLFEEAYLSLTPPDPFNAPSSLYTVDLTTGAATLVGPVGGGLRLEGLTVVTLETTTSTFQFSLASYGVAESTANLGITINRTGDTTLPATVDFQTDDTNQFVRCDIATGTASPRCDYATTVGTATFAAGETTRTFLISIADDVFVEGDESFTISLRNATGNSSLGAASIATVTIIDNDTTAPTAATNPIDQPEFFVRQQYLDFLSREPDTPGFTAFVARLRGCPAGDTSCDRIAVAAAFSRSVEYLENKGFFLIRFYSAAFGRRPTYQEFVRDLQRLTVATDAEVAPRRDAFTLEFTQREEFRLRFNSLSNEAFVNRLYDTAGIVLTATARNQIVTDLNSNQRSRAQVLRELVDSSAFFNQEFNAGFVLSQYFGFLRRDPDEQGFQDFLRILNTNPGDVRTVVANFVNSTEYRLRFGVPGP
ncbi:MAG: DUF4394 domain-containing protein, partial [Pyrinomonadaceae bacterium]|nr:DUF4394 domain-containing protein [Pyrinomonadaceae bacterium]